ncbi:murein transglycosylase A [Qipengyuania nanhaisediminis]|uniref:murein transglycosylase A n=1 Tax=Qipengyuania nanhaisediminis TaxID=604088 RepID=UPI0038B3D33F
MLLLAACVRLVPESRAPTPGVSVPPPIAATSAVMAGIAAGPDVGALPIAPEDARAALASFIESCPRLLRREDKSGLASAADWRGVCEAAASWPSADALRFFRTRFETARVSDGSAFATGYFEPEIMGSRTRRPGIEVPVYGMPGDLVRGWPAETPPAERTGRAPLGRYDENGNHVPYYERAEIEDGALAGRAPVIAWVADPVEFFFLQIQGSGRLRTPEGDVIRIGYAGQNGRGYTGIGGVMRERGLLGDGPGQYPGSMQGIMAYIRENPAEGRELMRMNKSWVFFRELTGDGPLGALGVPVRSHASVAADPAFVPLGAPVWLDLDRDEADGLWIAQDTGGAIKGANRFDTFWGAGAQARRIAGGMSARGTALVLLPKGTLDRLDAAR